MKLTKKIVRELLDYDSLTGVLTWKWRDRKWFTSDRIWNTWNTRFAGKEAFTSEGDLGRRAGALLGKFYYAHRIIFLWMKGRWPDPEVDHEDQDPGNNRWKNLIEVTHKKNMQNKRKRKDNTSGATGVFRTQYGRFEVYIGVDGKGVRLGVFKSFDKAVAAREAAKKQYGFSANHGERR